jgi:hypothetical protein
MRFGIISGLMLTIGGPTIVVLLLCFPFGDDPFATVGEFVVMLVFPVALLFGILGLSHDRRKPLAIVTTLFAGGITLLLCVCWIGMVRR